MSPATGTALLLLAAFVLPGFVTILVKERIYEVPAEQQGFERLLQTLYYSLLVYAVPTAIALLGGADRDWFERLFNGRADLRLTGALALAIALALPVTIAYGGRRWMVSPSRLKVLNALKISLTHRTPSSWDFMWEDDEPCLVVATLKDARTIAGYYGKRSHSGYGSLDRDLFLEEQWRVTSADGAMQLEPVDRSLGVWIEAQEIVSVERYAGDDAQLEEVRRKDG